MDRSRDGDQSQGTAEERDGAGSEGTAEERDAAGSEGTAEERFDLLPFLRLEFGSQLRPDLEGVFLVRGIAFTRDGTSIEHAPELGLEVHLRAQDGSTAVTFDEHCLGEHDPARPFHEYVLDYLKLDDYSWIQVCDILRDEVARAIAAETERPEDADYPRYPY